MKDRSTNQRPTRKPSRRNPGRHRQSQERRKVRLFHLVTKIISQLRQGTD